MLIIHGSSDATVPIDTAGPGAAKLISGSTLIENAGAPHGLFATEPNRRTRTCSSARVILDRRSAAPC